LLEALANHQGPVIPVGTTSVRSIESIYWYGVRVMLQNEPISAHFSVNQWEPYGHPTAQLPPAREVFAHIVHKMKQENLSVIQGDTSLIIVPGYRFAVTKGLVTNFHQPGSTLLMLVSALVGDRWRDAYQFALESDFRFLSYGDACLLMP
jgi:S-adenosylmethionine:tRNA ribosyltransferase-isomerase